MFTQIKTSKANKMIVTDLSRKFNLGAENTIARIAIAYSLSKGEKMNLANISDSQGKEYSKNVLFGSNYPFYISLICVMENNPNLNGIDYLIDKIDAGLKLIVENND